MSKIETTSSSSPSNTNQVQDIEAEAQDELVQQEVDQIASSSHHQLANHPQSFLNSQLGWDDSDQEEEGEQENEEEEEEDGSDSGSGSNDENDYDDQEEEQEENGLQQIPTRAWASADSTFEDFNPYQDDPEDAEAFQSAPLRLRSSKSRNSNHPPPSPQNTKTFKSRFSSVWTYLTKGSSHSRGKGSGGGLPASLSLPLVSANLFAASLHPGVLLSMPYYFGLTGVAWGVVGLILIAGLGGVGGGLFVVLSRYVQGLTVEEITGQSFGRHNRWKGNVGRCTSGLLLATYAMMAAWVAYGALSDLLLQIFFHYSPRGIPLHDRSFITFVIGGLLTTPLVIFPLAKRNLIKLSTWIALLSYPAVVTILIVKSREEDQGFNSNTPLLHWKTFSSPFNFNPLKPPSIWAPISLLPLLTLSSSPLQILAHNRSLRRSDQSKSNVKAFMVAQTLQVAGVVAISTAVGVGIKLDLGIDSDTSESSIGPNFFSSLSTSSDLFNACRVVFVLLLSSHLSLCLVTARSSWGRLLKLLRLNPFRKEKKKTADQKGKISNRELRSSSTSVKPKKKRKGVKLPPPKNPLTWSKLARNSLAGLLLWTFTSTLSYLSSSGGFRKKDRQGEEARFILVQKVTGLLGAVVGWVLPSLVWIILFHIRRPRAILPSGQAVASGIGRKAGELIRGTLGLLAGRRKGKGNGQIRLEGEENQLLLPFGIARGIDGEIMNDGGESDPLPDMILNPRKAARDSRTDPITSFNEDRDSQTRSQDDQEDEEEATLNILLARKERELQKRTRGRRKWQDLLVLAALLPLGLSIIVLGSLDLRYSKAVKW